MSGIVFLSTTMRDEMVEFYTSRFGMTVWIEQEDCTILREDNLILGFCQRDKADSCGIITFWVGSNGEVDALHAKHSDIAEGPPQVNERYRIYHFFLRDPEGRRLEIQRFLDL
ncbi:VOC family protein [Candidatus Bathyarchaeota archaeon]|nr:VOC family protein [Candidatus Bathyarchaeota archaeon]